jgi:hypothetical protein
MTPTVKANDPGWTTEIEQNSPRDLNNTHVFPKTPACHFHSCVVAYSQSLRHESGQDRWRMHSLLEAHRKLHGIIALAMP